MKYYVLIFITLCFGFGCRSSRNVSDTSFRDLQHSTLTSISNETIQTETSTLSVISSAKETNINEYIRTTSFDSLGRVSAVQEQWRGTRQNELSDSSGRQTDGAIINRNDSTTTEENIDIELNQATQSNTDSRPVQGWREWGVIAIIIGVVGLIIYFIKPKKI